VIRGALIFGGKLRLWASIWDIKLKEKKWERIGVSSILSFFYPLPPISNAFL
jgi:hypothetical protein